MQIRALGDTCSGRMRILNGFSVESFVSMIDILGLRCARVLILVEIKSIERDAYSVAVEVS